MACGSVRGRVTSPLAPLHGLPQLLVHDPEMRHLCDDLSAGRGEPRDPAARGRILDEAQPAPHLAAAIQLVVEDAGALLGVPADRRVTPGPAVGSGHAALVQGPRDGARPLAGGEPAEDLAHDLGLGLIDLPLAGPPGPLASRPVARS